MFNVWRVKRRKRGARRLALGIETVPKRCNRASDDPIVQAARICAVIEGAGWRREESRIEWQS